jgi:ribosomal protein S18 acetylase RimI-like enzyme
VTATPEPPRRGDGTAAPPFVLRVATPADAAVLAGLNHHAQIVHHERVPEWFPPPGDPDVVDVLRRWLRGPAAVGFVAETDGRAIGYVLAGVHHRPATPLTREGAWIDLDQIAVVPEARRRGVARALCQQVIAHARHLGLDEVQLNVWSFNAEAQALFTSLGFESRSLRLSLNTRSGEPGEGEGPA